MREENERKRGKNRSKSCWINVHVVVYFNTNSQWEKIQQYHQLESFLGWSECFFFRSKRKREDLTLGCWGMFAAIRFEHESKWEEKKTQIHTKQKEKTEKQKAAIVRHHLIMFDVLLNSAIVFSYTGTECNEGEEWKKKQPKQHTESTGLSQ